MSPKQEDDDALIVRMGATMSSGDEEEERKKEATTTTNAAAASVNTKGGEYGRGDPVMGSCVSDGLDDSISFTNNFETHFLGCILTCLLAAKEPTPLEAGGVNDERDEPEDAEVEDAKPASAAAATVETTVSGNDANHDNNESKDEDEEGSLDVGACCLCHCSLDYSDRAAFFRADREEDYDDNDNDDDDDYFYRRTDPYLPTELYDKSNALVYCDGCDRLYHQKCHFVPLLVVPRGKWHCLVCQSLNTKNKMLVTPSKKGVATITTTTTKKAAASSNKKKNNCKAGKNINTKTKKKATSPAAVLDVTAPIAPLSKQEWRKRADELFVSPPPPPNSDTAELQALEGAWESDTRLLKATAWKTELQHRLRQFTATQATNYRLAYTTILTLTSTSKNRKFSSSSSHGRCKSSTTVASQELAQTLVRFYGARLQWREMCLSLESMIRGTDARNFQLIDGFCRTYEQDQKKKNDTDDHGNNTNDKKEDENGDDDDFVRRVLFPFGRNLPRRIEPRTPEMKLALQEAAAAAAAATGKKNHDESIPKDIFLPPVASKSTTNNNRDDDNNKKASPKKKRAAAQPKPTPPKRGKNAARAAATCTVVGGKKKRGAALKKGHDDDLGDDGISLDDLKCCICHVGDASDENDLIMCDGCGCYRAYHMHCLQPPVTLHDLENTTSDDWFCPLCSSLAETMLTIQTEYMGDDWEARRYKKHYGAHLKKGKAAKGGKNQKNNNIDDDDESSLASWAVADQVFEGVEQDYAAACLLKSGQRNKATDDLLARVLGIDELPDHDYEDDEEEDGHFDLQEFQEGRKRLKLEEKQQSPDKADNDSDAHEDEDDESDHSSQATLVEMSSVELEIDKDELDALSKYSDDEEEDDMMTGLDGKSAVAKKRPTTRRSRRLRSTGGTAPTSSANNSSAGDDSDDNNEEGKLYKGHDPGEFDEANIVQGKRNRKPVDYRKLNECIFGDVTENERLTLDDAEDFTIGRTKTKKLASASSSSKEEESGSDGSEGDDDKDDNSDDGNDKQGKGKTSKTDGKPKAKATADSKRGKSAAAASASAKPLPKKKAGKAKNEKAAPSNNNTRASGKKRKAPPATTKTATGSNKKTKTTLPAKSGTKTTDTKKNATTGKRRSASKK
jgi:hypothetical protein